MCVKLLQLYPTLCDPMDYSTPGSSVHGILQARILEWVAVSSSRGSSQPRDQTCVSCIVGRFFTTEPSSWLYFTNVLSNPAGRIHSVAIFKALQARRRHSVHILAWPMLQEITLLLQGLSDYSLLWCHHLIRPVCFATQQVSSQETGHKWPGLQPLRISSSSYLQKYCFP